MKGLPCSRVRCLALLLPVILFAFPAQQVAAKPAKLLDIADTVAASRILTNFTAMIQGSDLGTFLSSRGPFILFAPTDSAFARLPPGTMDALLRPENKERLQRILLFHVVNGKKLTAKDLQPMPTLLSCEGDPLTLKMSKSGIQFVLKARITHADIKCLNGIIHQIDTVLMPPEKSLPPLAPPPPAPAADAPANSPPDTNAAPVVMPDGSISTDTNTVPVAPVAPAPSN